MGALRQPRIAGLLERDNFACERDVDFFAFKQQGAMQALLLPREMTIGKFRSSQRICPVPLTPVGESDGNGRKVRAAFRVIHLCGTHGAVLVVRGERVSPRLYLFIYFIEDSI
jgi:hypothetical protein